VGKMSSLIFGNVTCAGRLKPSLSAPIWARSCGQQVPMRLFRPPIMPRSRGQRVTPVSFFPLFFPLNQSHRSRSAAATFRTYGAQYSKLGSPHTSLYVPTTVWYLFSWPYTRTLT